MNRMDVVRVNSAARLDRLPVGTFHRRLVFLVGGGLFFHSFDVNIAGAVLGVFLKSGFSTLDLNAYFISATFAGMFIGIIGAGILADRSGRRFTFQFNLAIFGLASLAGAAVPSMDWLIVPRFVCGVGLGAEIVLCYSTLSEFVPPSKRGRWVAALSMMSSFGLLVSTLLSWALIPHFGWRIMFVIPGIGALIILWMRKVLPELPRWLEVHGRTQEADEVVSAIEAESSASGAVLSEPQPVSVPKPESLFQRKLIRPLVLGTIMQGILFAALYGVVSWVPTFLIKQGMPINQSLGQATLMALGGPSGAFLALLLVDHIGRRTAIICGSLLATILSVAFGQVTSQTMGVIVGFAMFSVIYFLLATVQAVYLSELFPTSVRMRSNAICVGIARITTMGVPFVVVFLFNSWGVMGVVSTIAGLLVAQAAAMALLGRETRRQSLEVIAAGART